MARRQIGDAVKRSGWVGPALVVVVGLLLLYRKESPPHGLPREGQLVPITQREFKLGGLAEGEEVELQVILLNEGDLPVRVRRLHTTCGCTIASADKTIVAGGESIELRVRVDTRVRGSQSADVLLDVEGSKASLLAARVSFEVAAALEVLPRLPHVVWDSTRASEAQSFPIEFTVPEGELSTLLSCEFDRPGIGTRWDVGARRGTLWLTPDFAVLARGVYYTHVSLEFKEARLNLRQSVMLSVDATRASLTPTVLLASPADVDGRAIARGRLDWDGESAMPSSAVALDFDAQVDVRSRTDGSGFELELLLPEAPTRSLRGEVRIITEKGPFIAPVLIPADFGRDPSLAGGQLVPLDK